MNNSNPRRPGQTPGSRTIRIPVRRVDSEPQLPVHQPKPTPDKEEAQGLELSPPAGPTPEHEALAKMKNRLQKRYAEQAVQEKIALLRDLLPVLDDLQAALAASANEPIAMRQGLELTIRHFMHTLSMHDVHPIAALGKPFDPHYHEALSQIKSTQMPAGYVVQVVQQGYLYGERLLRPARVVVAG